ncbi:hypothetical protein HOLleu_34620 [Holothuria leucospilota]|uniref:Coiled-coil domain-containing protein 148 n=1 Tax=Holothuria leucospilota TaxID=206669 RepID=A0A9Q0YQB8_HOLLE|nr:hypothetical protein HOLleu_34620 [Holothuria leucospilota]
MFTSSRKKSTQSITLPFFQCLKMTGRDYRAFLSTHRSGLREIGRTDEADKLLVRMKEGFGSSRYQKQDYEKLRMMALEKKISANRSLLKMNKLQATSQSHKENTLLKQHRTVWKQNMIKLENARKTAASDQSGYFDDATSEMSHISMFMLDMEELKLQLDSEREEFKNATVDPVWNLREDLQAWINDHETKLKANVTLALRTEHEEVSKVVKDVKEQQEKILKHLEQDQLALEEDLDTDFLRLVGEGGGKRVIEGIPEEAEDLECPDDDLRDLILTEFLLLDNKFKDKLKELDQKYEHVLRPPLGGWKREDHFHFQVILEQYPFTLNNRRALYMDRLKRQFPRKTRAELVEHEEWITAMKYYKELRKTQITCWARAKEELYHKAVATFADAFLAEELHWIEAINKKKQQEICSELYKKVQKWREQKLEAAKLEAELQMKNREKLERQRRLEEEINKKKRAADKEKISAFHEKRRQEEEQEEEEKKKKLEILQKEMEEQAKIDKERVDYRKQMQEEKRLQLEGKKHQEYLDEVEREKRLDAIRQLVAVHVESDPYRVMKPTKASNAKIGIGAEEDINIQRPLFDMQGFSSDQVTSDPRIKLEEALRKAGLHKNPYARKMIFETKPQKAPRRDMESTVLKNMEKQ